MDEENQEKVNNLRQRINKLKEEIEDKVVAEPLVGPKVSGKFKFPTLNFACEVFNETYAETKNVENIATKFKKYAVAHKLAKEKFYGTLAEGSPMENKLAFFNELDKTLNIENINYDLNNIEELKVSIKEKVTQIITVLGITINTPDYKETKEALVNAYTNWHLSLFAIGAQHLASSNASDEMVERREKIITNLKDEKWWDAAKTSPKEFEDEKKIKATVTEDGRKRLIIARAHELEGQEITTVINRTIDELSNVEVINWKNVVSKGEFETQAEGMCLVKWKRVAFDGVETDLSKTMPKEEKGNWNAWVNNIFTKSEGSQAWMGDKALKTLIEYIGNDKDTLMEFISDIILNNTEKNTAGKNNLTEVINVLSDGQKKIIEKAYKQKDDDTNYVKAKKKYASEKYKEGNEQANKEIYELQQAKL